MPTAAQAALSGAHSVLRTQLGRSYTFGESTFVALPAMPSTRSGPGERGLALGLEFDIALELGSDALTTMPKPGETVTDATSGEVLLVSGVRELPGAHISTIYCRRPQ